MLECRNYRKVFAYMFEISIYVGAVIDVKNNQSAYGSKITTTKNGEVITKEVFQKFEYVSLKSALIQGVIDTVNLVKKPSNIKIHLLQNGIDNYFQNPTISEKSFLSIEMRENAINIMCNSKHNISFITVYENDPEREIIKGLKRKAKKELANQPTEVIKGKNQKNINTRDSLSYLYLEGLSSDTKSWIIYIDGEYGLNLYHSIQATFAHKFSSYSSIEEAVAHYFSIKSNRGREFLKQNEDKVTELIRFCFEKTKKTKIVNAKDYTNGFKRIAEFSDETNDWLNEIYVTTGFNLFISIESVTDPNKNVFLHLDDWVEYYYSKYKDKRPYLIGNKDKLREIFKHSIEKRKQTI